MIATTRLDRFTPTSGQRAMIAALDDALRAPAAAPALLLVTGDPASGKSALIAELVSRMARDPGFAIALIADAAAMHSDGRLLRGMIAAFDEAPTGRSGIELLTTLRAIFAAHAASGRRPLLVIDGAEALTGSQLEIVRSLLTPPVGDDGPATTHPAILLTGRPEINERIRRRRPLARRRTHDLQLAAPDRDDLTHIIGGTPEQAEALIAAAIQRDMPPLALTALVLRQTDAVSLDDALLQTALRRAPSASPAQHPATEVVQGAMPFAPANRDGNGVLQLSLLHHAAGHAGIEAGGGDR